MLDTIHVGDCRETMRAMIAAGVRVNCIVTSPPYFGLRDYGTAKWEGGSTDCNHRKPNSDKGHIANSTLGGGLATNAAQIGGYRDACGKCGAVRIDSQIGLEASPVEYVETLREVFSLARELLADDGTLWLNLGDSYNAYNGNRGQSKSLDRERDSAAAVAGGSGLVTTEVKNKDLIGIPWRVAFALQADGWYLRSDIIWHKPNPMPESVTDRPTKSHEYLFLMSRSERYHYDADAIAEPLGSASIARLSQDVASQDGSDRVPGKTNGPMKAVGKRRAPGNTYHKSADAFQDGDDHHRTKAGLVSFCERERAKVEAGELAGTRNARSVWNIATQGFGGAHFATFPRDLVRRCILAGSRPGDTVFDPFMGSGTVAEVALDMGRHYVGCELNPEYAAMFKTHRSQQQGMAL